MAFAPELAIGDAPRKAVHVAARAVIFLSLLAQALIVGKSWWDFDPRLSCNRLPGWSEWIDCLHGRSHLYVHLTEMALVGWIIAGIATGLGRILPIYISAIVPALAFAVIFLFAIDYWQQAVMPYAQFGRPELWDVFAFALVVAECAVFLIGPVVGAWLLGLGVRGSRRAV